MHWNHWSGDALTIARRANHDLRSPLGSVATTSELLGELIDSDEESHQSLLKNLDGSAAEALSILARLVLILRASYTDSPDTELVATEMIADRVVVRLESLRKKRGASLRMGSDWPTLEAVDEWLDQALNALVENALQHGGNEVEIGSTEEPGGVSLWVRDNGPGLPKHRLSIPIPAFESLHEHSHLSGFGLPLARRLVELMGGELRYRRLPGDISEFSIFMRSPVASRDLREDGALEVDDEISTPPSPTLFLEPLTIQLSPAVQEFDTLLFLTRRLLAVPVAMVSLPEDDEIVVTASGLEETFEAGGEQFMEASGACMGHSRRVISRESMVREIPGEEGSALRSFLGLPILGFDGEVAGCISVSDTVPREWTEEEEAILADFGHLAEKELRLRVKRVRLAAALQRVREDEMVNQSILDNSPDCISLLDGEGRLLNVNAAGRAIMEFDESFAFQGMLWTELWPETSRDLAERALEEARQGRTGHFQALCPTQKGRWRWRDVIVTGIQGTGDTVEKILSISRDITASKQEEISSKASEQSLRNVLDSIFSFVALLNPLGEMLEVNAAALAVTGVTLDEVLGKPFADGPWWKHSEAERAAMARDVVAAALGKAVRRNATVWTMGDRIIDVDVSIVPAFDEEGNVTHLVPSAIDLTPRLDAERAGRESERRFQLLADNMSQFSWIAEASGDIVWYNRQWFDYTGTTLEEMRGWGWKSVHHPDHLDRVVKGFERCLATQTPWEDTFPLRGHDGRYRWFLTRATPIRDGRGRVVQWFGTNTDITRLREIELELRKASQAKDDFIAVLSHELRTPLSPALLISSAAAFRDDLPPEVKRDFDVIRKHVEMEARLIDDLLDFTRVLRGKMPLVVTDVPFDAILSESIGLLEGEAGPKGVAVETSLQARELHMQADEVRLRQILWNVMRNAVKFTPAGGTIRVSTRFERGELVIEIRDTGAGVSEDEIETIFEPFTQGRLRTQYGLQRSSGLGLGLAISRMLVEQHGGTIRAASGGLDLGTTFTITLPIVESGEKGEEASSVPPEIAHPELPPAGPLRILLVEDHEATRETLAVLLRNRGHSVVEARGVVEGYLQSRDGRFDLLISDIGLPDGRGEELLIRLVAEGKGMSAIALSGYGMESDVERSHRAGFNLHLTKPVTIGDLDRALARVAARS